MTEKFREYLFSSWCVVFTDNNPLSHLSAAKLGATEHRWATQLAAFNVKIRYRSGRSNRNADTLSRQNPSESRVVGGINAGNRSAHIFAAGLRDRPGSRGTTLYDCYCAWLFSGRLGFPAGSRQFVAMNEEVSYRSQVHYGEPQGSVLGPLLFML